MKQPSVLSQWVDFAERGERMVYHVGSYAHGDICREAMDLYEAGLISLVRKRGDQPGVFQYIAQRTKMERRA
jgi:hypothetical protein